MPREVPGREPSRARRAAYSLLYALGVMLIPSLVAAAIFPGIMLMNYLNYQDDYYCYLLVSPVVALADTFMPTRFGGRQRPHFVIKRWISLDGEQNALPAPVTTSTRQWSLAACSIAAISSACISGESFIMPATSLSP